MGAGRIHFIDNYFIDRDQTPLDENGEYDFESLYALKLDLFNDHLQKLIAGEEVLTPIYNFQKGCCEEEGLLIKVPAGEPILIEGIHALNEELTAKIPYEQKFRIYVSALTQLNIDYTNRIPTTDSRLLRRMIRTAVPVAMGHYRLSALAFSQSWRREEHLPISGTC